LRRCGEWKILVVAKDKSYFSFVSTVQAAGVRNRNLPRKKRAIRRESVLKSELRVTKASMLQLHPV
jgi:hypothetical protein